MIPVTHRAFVALFLASLALGACDSSPQASPIADAAVSDTGAPKKDAGFIDLDGGPIFDAGFLDWIEANLPALMARDAAALAYAVKRSCEIKAFVVGQDERETGMRAILNFGHTFGHAIENGLGYGQWLHGEAVGCGMGMAAHLSMRLGLVDAAFVQRLTQLIERAGLPVAGPRLPDKGAAGGATDSNADRYLSLMRVDKKADAGTIQFVVIERGGVAAVRTAPDALVRTVVDACCA